MLLLVCQNAALQGLMFGPVSVVEVGRFKSSEDEDICGNDEGFKVLFKKALKTWQVYNFLKKRKRFILMANSPTFPTPFSQHLHKVTKYF